MQPVMDLGLVSYGLVLGWLSLALAEVIIGGLLLFVWWRIGVMMRGRR
jgi:hypothetical protein